VTVTGDVPFQAEVHAFRLMQRVERREEVGEMVRQPSVYLESWNRKMEKEKLPAEDLVILPRRRY
jgi:hypothetical protein